MSNEARNDEKGTEMYSQFSPEMVQQRHRQLLAEADTQRLAKVAREGRRQHIDEQRAVLGLGRAVDALARFFHRTPECPDQVAPAR